MARTTVTTIDSSDVAEMTQHWLGCPAGAYLGQDYGNDLRALLQSPLAAGQADGFISKIRSDIPIIGASADSDVSLYALPTGVDSQVLILEVAGEQIMVNSGEGA